MLNAKQDRRAIDFDIKVAWLAIARMYNARAVPQGLTTNVGFVLLHIDNAEGTPATKIAPLMGMEPRSLSRMLARLQERNLIYRVADKKDGRMVRIFLTEEGLRLKQVAREVVIDFNKKVYAHIPEDQLAVFFSVMDQMMGLIEAEQTGNDIFEEED